MKKPSQKGNKGKKKTPHAFKKFEKRTEPEWEEEKPVRKPVRKPAPVEEASAPLPIDKPYRLNRYIAQSGVCSRREADKLIASGQIKVNGKVVTELGTKVNVENDKVEYKGKTLKIATDFVYILMNKPKNHITTVKDEKGRRTVMDIVKNYTDQRVFPVGRLDRNTTGLLLFTNDGELAERLAHPSFKVRKLYHVRLDQEVTEEHLDQLRAGIELEDGVVKADKVAWVEGGFTNEVGIQIHSGKNRVVRRMFEHLGYQVEKLDRVSIGPLTKKNIPRGKCRLLTPKEINFLKMM